MDDKAAERLPQVIAVVAAFGLLAVALLTTADVLMRYVLGMPIRGMTEVAALTCAVAVAAFFPALVARRANVTIRLLGSVLGTRAGRWLDAFGSLLTAAFLCLLCWQLLIYARDMGAAGELTPFLRLPVGPWWLVVAAAFALAAAVGLTVLVRDVRAAAGSSPR
jgi:TRAP-type C4-dicarboxylate transport system permease small subunit